MTGSQNPYGSWGHIAESPNSTGIFMKFAYINPFVRWAQITSYLPYRDYRIAYDCRLFYILEGKGQFFADETPYPAEAGSLFFIPCGKRYRLLSDKVTPLSFFVSNFDLTYEHCDTKTVMFPMSLSSYSEDDRLTQPIIDDETAFNDYIILNASSDMQSVVENIAKHFRSSKPQSDMMISAYMKILLCQIAQTLSLKTNKSNYIIESIKKFLQKHYAEEITNDSVSQELNYHSYYLNSLFKKAEGITIHAYLTNYRLQQAAFLLTETDLSIREIAEQTGFASPEHFCFLFKKHFHRPPSFFRKR